MVENDTDSTCLRVALDGSIGATPECGGLVLVAGDVSASVHRRISRALLDGPLPTYRRILVVPTLESDVVDEYLPPSARHDGTHLQLVGYEARNGTTGGPDAGQDPKIRAGSVRRTGLDLGAIGMDVSELISSVVRSTDELVPGELQVCLDGFERLADAADEFTVVKFAHLLQSRVEKANGVVYVHVHRSSSSSLVTQLTPVSDARIAVRGTAATPEYRVHRSDGATTEWTTLESNP